MEIVTNMKKDEIISVTKTILVDEFKKDIKKNSKLFSNFEKKLIQKKSYQTGSGMLALKNALIELIEKSEGISLTETNIEISHSKNGAPKLDKLERVKNQKDYLFSIAHTKKSAVAVAAKRGHRK